MSARKKPKTGRCEFHPKYKGERRPTVSVLMDGCRCWALFNATPHGGPGLRAKNGPATNAPPSAEAYIDGDDIVIRVPIRNLPAAVEQGPLWPHAKVTDAKAFAKYVVNELNNECQIDGPTRVHRLLEDAIEAAIECDLWPGDVVVTRHKKKRVAIHALGTGDFMLRGPSGEEGSTFHLPATSVASEERRR